MNPGDTFQRIVDWIRRLLYVWWVLFGGGNQPPQAPPQPAPPGFPFPFPFPPVNPPAPKPTADPEGATVRISVGNSGCTATVCHPRRADGRWELLTAAHCVRGVGSVGTARFKDGKSLPFEVIAYERNYDLAWGVINHTGPLPAAFVATSRPPAGSAVWHMGYGVHRPGNRETGEVKGYSSGGSTVYTSLSVSSGDSGSGVFSSDTGELIGVVSGYSGRTNVSGTAEKATLIRPKPAEQGLVDYGP